MNCSSSFKGLDREISTLTACLSTVLMATLSSSMGLDAWTYSRRRRGEITSGRSVENM